MSKALVLSLGTLGIGGVGLGVAGVHYFRKTPEAPKVTFSIKYSKALLTNVTDDAIGITKLTSLAKASSVPKNKHLVRAKSEKNGSKPDEAKASLQEGCKEIYLKAVGNKDDFYDFKNFCSFNNGDKIASGKALVTEEGDFTSLGSTFSSMNRDDLYGGFKDAYDIKGDSADAIGWKAKMLEKCREIALDIFEEPISNFNTFCVKANGVGA